MRARAAARDPNRPGSSQPGNELLKRQIELLDKAQEYRLPGRCGGTGRHLRPHEQPSCEQLIDRYKIACRPVRDVLVDYLRERQPSVDFSSLQRFAYLLGKLFWADLEAHHPGIDSLKLPRDVAAEWKQ